MPGPERSLGTSTPRQRISSAEVSMFPLFPLRQGRSRSRSFGSPSVGGGSLAFRPLYARIGKQAGIEPDLDTAASSPLAALWPPSNSALLEARLPPFYCSPPGVDADEAPKHCFWHCHLNAFLHVNPSFSHAVLGSCRKVRGWE